MRQLPQKLDLHEIDFIDLRNPQAPLVELVGSGAIELPSVENASNDESETIPETNSSQSDSSEQPQQELPAESQTEPHP
jgi:hypothetical protein